MHVFFSTEPAPCPYLDHRLERRLVTTLAGPDVQSRHDRLVLAGFRRSQGFAYRPVCPGCSACVPVRIPVAAFRFARKWRKVLRHNADLVAAERPVSPTEEQFELFRRYLVRRHPEGGMAEMGWADYRAMVEDSPPSTALIEWRRPDRSLIGVSLTDRCASGLSGVYKFFEPAEPKRSLGTLIILWHIRQALAEGRFYVYLGYWIAQSPKMAYKARFQPLEQLTARGWEPLSPVAVAPPPAEPTARTPALLLD
jgi:arginine-tRNA-protein transferase